MARRLLDGRIVCVGTGVADVTLTIAQVLEPPQHGSPDETFWQWRALPAPSIMRWLGSGCVLSDGRFAIFGWSNNENYDNFATCESLTLDASGDHWDPLPPMLEGRVNFVCEAISGCVIVAGGCASVTAEVYEEALGRWWRLPCDAPHDFQLQGSGSAVM
jgi:hypothetical protein